MLKVKFSYIKKILKLSTTKIDDYGLSYTEIYMKVAPDHFMALGHCKNYHVAKDNLYS